MKNKTIFILLCMISLISISIFAQDNTNAVIKNIYKDYRPNLEMGGCMSSFFYNNTLKIDSWRFGAYGNETHVNWFCPSFERTMFHTHPIYSVPCEFSQYDIDYFSHSTYYVSIVFCGDNTYRVMYKENTYIFSKVIESPTIFEVS